MSAPRGRPAGRRAPGEHSIYWVESIQKWRGAVSVGGRHTRRRRTVQGDTRKEVIAKLNALADVVDQPEPITVSELAHRWFQDQQRVEDGEASTRSTAWDRIDKHIVNDRIGRAKLGDLTVIDVEAWLDAKMMAGYVLANGECRLYSREYMNKIRQDLKSMLDWAMVRRMVPFNAVVGTRLRKGEPRGRKRSLTVEQAEALLAEAVGTHRRYGPYVILCLLTGMRPGEAAGLSWDEVDFDAGEIHVRQALQRHGGGRPLAIGPTKTDDHRTLRLDPLLADALHHERKLQATLRLAAGPAWSKDWDGLVFLGALGEPPWGGNLRRAMRQIAADADAGIPDDLDLYELRHSCASLLDAAGVAVHDIIDQLGHKDTRMFYKHYRHPTKRVAGSTWR